MGFKTAARTNRFTLSAISCPLERAVATLFGECAMVIDAPTPLLASVRHRHGVMEIRAILDGRAARCVGPLSAIHYLAGQLWKIPRNDLYGLRKVPKQGMVNLIEQALFVGALETPMRAVARALYEDGHQHEAALCLLRVIFPEDALDDPLGKLVFTYDPTEEIPKYASSAAGWTRRNLSYITSPSALVRLAALRHINMTLQDVLDETSGKRLSDIVSECRQAMIVRREDGVLAIGDLARLILAQIA